MRCVRHVPTALFVIFHAQAMQLKANSSTSSWPSWLRAVLPSGGATCGFEGNCLEGHGSGICFVSVDAWQVPHPLSSTLEGNGADFVNNLDGSVQPVTAHFVYPPESPETAIHSLLVWGRSAATSWNLCLTPTTPDRRDSKHANTDRQDLQVTWSMDVNDYCFWVNGLCWLWVSPCSGATWCGHFKHIQQAMGTWPLDSFCPGGVRYAKTREFNRATPTLYANKEAFHAKCAAGPLDPLHDHCDLEDNFVREEDYTHHELILVCDGAGTPNPTPNPTPNLTPNPTPTPTRPDAGIGGSQVSGGIGGFGAPVAAVGDPHLQNVYGQRFDLMRPGKHTLIQIPRERPVENAVLRVEAFAVQLGVQCTDMYFQELNITGAWVEAKRTGGFHFKAQDAVQGETPTWERFGKVYVKVAHGHTQEGTRYLNFYVKHLASAGFAVGGLLGEDDHTQAVTPLGECVRRSLSLLQISS